MGNGELVDSMISDGLWCAFDAVHMGAGTERYTGELGGIVTTNGIFRPFALVDGRAVATWGLAGGVVTIRPVGPITPGTRAALRAEADDVLRYLGLPPTLCEIDIP